MSILQIQGSRIFERNYNAQTRFTVNQGGTSSGKTFSILQSLILIAYNKPNILISVVSESLPHLKRGVIRDFISLLTEYGIYREANHNKTDNTFKIGNSKIEFFSADQPDKLRGARRDYLFINECNNIDEESFNQLEVRTKNRVFLDYNPTSEFWVHKSLIGKPETTFIKSTYLDNPFLDEAIVKAIERRKDLDPNWWRVYGLGEVGNIEGLVFDNFHIVDEVPKDAKSLGYGVDFGYTNDPTTVNEIFMYNNEIYTNELVYNTGLTNRDIFNKVKDIIDLTAPAYADSAEPKSIDELYYLGWQGIKPVVKGADSIRNGIQIMKQYKINITKNSVNTIKEFRNYRWATDKFGKTITPEKPIDSYNHNIDGIRYGIMMTLGNEKNKNVVEIDIF